MVSTSSLYQGKLISVGGTLYRKQIMNTIPTPLNERNHRPTWIRGSSTWLGSNLRLAINASCVALGGFSVLSLVRV